MMELDSSNTEKASWVLPEVPGSSNGIAILQGAIKQTLGILTQAEVSEGSMPLPIGERSNCRLIILSAHSNAMKKLLEGLLEWVYNDDNISEDETTNPLGSHYYFLPIEGADASFWAVARLFKDLGMGTIVYVSSFLADACATPEKGRFLSKKCLRYTLETRYFHSGACEIRELLLRDADLTHHLISGRFCGPAIRLLLGAWCSGDLDLTNTQMLFLLSKLLDKPIGELPKTKIKKMYDDIKSHRELVGKKHSSRLSDYANGRTILLIEDKLNEEGWDLVIPLIFGARPPVQDQKAFTREGLEALKLGGGSSSSFEINSDHAPGNFQLVHFRTAREAKDWLKTKEQKNIDLVILDLYSSEVPPATHSKGAHPVTISQKIWELVHVLREQNPGPTRKITEPAIIAFTAEENPMAVSIFSTELGVTHFFFKSPSVAIHKSAYYASFRNVVIGSLTQSICQNLLIPAERRQNRFTEWFLQFREEHRPLILRLMRHYRYFTAKDVLTILGKWANSEFRKLKSESNSSRLWISYLGRPNKSGPATLSLFGKSDWVRDNAASVELLSYAALKQRVRWYESCDTWNEEDALPENKDWNDQKRKSICVILVDDVIGTGGQAMDYFPKLFVPDASNDYEKHSDRIDKLLKNLLKNNVVFHIVYALGVGDRQPPQIPAKGVNWNFHASLHVAYCPTSLGELDRGFQGNVKEALKEYPLIVKTRENEFPCEFEPSGWKGKKKHRNGRGNGGLFSTYANTPGNTLPVIWGEEGWTPLFHRIFNPLAKKESEKDANAIIRECDAQGSCKLTAFGPCRSRQEWTSGKGS